MMVIEIESAFPIEWGAFYYTVESREANVVIPCPACDNTGRVVLKGEMYVCPRCQGHWHMGPVARTETVYYVGYWMLEAVVIQGANNSDNGYYTTENDYEMHFQRIDAGVANARYARIALSGNEIAAMEAKHFGKSKKFYNDYAVVAKEVERLNAGLEV